jgi:dTDP-4-dehydrorhamnose 3,5-epimerase
MDPLGFDGAWLFTPRIHTDRRGAFLEWFKSDELDRPLELAQANCSVSTRGVLRGVHFTDVPPGQAKYITCVSGSVLDVAVDLRTGSPTFGRWTAVRLDEESRQAVYLSEGLGHAFFTLSESATVVYLCSRSYAPDLEHGVNPLDPALGIVWPEGVEPILSDKDAAAPTLAEAAEHGLLPSYADCLAHYAQGRPGRV